MPVPVPSLPELLDEEGIEEIAQSHPRSQDTLVGKEIYVLQGLHKGSYGTIRAVSVRTVTVALEKSASSSKTDINLAHHDTVLM